MQAPPASWLILLGCLLAVLGVICWKQGPHRALGVTVVLSFLAPLWLKYDLFGLPIEVRTAATLAGLLVYCVHPEKVLFNRLVPLDLCIALLVGVETISDSLHGMSPVLAFLRAYGEWAIPYAAGRYAVRTFDDVRELGLVVLLVASLLGVVALAETFSGGFIYDPIFGHRPIDPRHPPGGVRLGWWRAYGPAHHAIFLGAWFALFFPWGIAAIKSARNLGERLAGCGATLLMLLGSLATITRSSWLAICGMPVVALAFTSRRWFLRIFTCGAVLTVLMALNFDAVTQWFQKLGNEHVNPRWTIDVDGEQVPVTSTMARVYMLKIWGPPLRQGGLFGYGTVATESFPPNVPSIRGNAKTLRVLSAVENGYLLQGLRLGWLGLGALVVTIAVAVWQFLIWRRLREGDVLALFLAASIVSYAGILLTVWMSYDMGFIFLWTIGLSSAILSQPEFLGYSRMR